MKLQLSGQTLRVRLSADDVDQLQHAGRCDDATSVAGFRWRRLLSLGDGPQPELSQVDGVWRLTVPRADFDGLLATLPRRDGLQYELAGDSADPVLEIRVEVDLRGGSRR